MLMIAISLPRLLADGGVALIGVGGFGLAVLFARRIRQQAASANEALHVADLENRRLAEHLTVSEERLHAIRRGAEALPFGVILLDATGHELLRNVEAAAVLGPESPSLDGEAKQDRRSNGEVMAGGTLRRLLDRGVDGHRGRESLDIVGPPRRSFVVAAEPIGDRLDGRFAVLGTVQDSSEQRGAEAMRQDFITNVSHELRTPVGAIAILAETLATETDRQAAARFGRDVETGLVHQAEQPEPPPRLPSAPKAPL